MHTFNIDVFFTLSRKKRVDFLEKIKLRKGFDMSHVKNFNNESVY